MGIFEAFRAIGYISDGVPFAVQRSGVETLVTVSVGKAWQRFNCSKLLLVFVGPQLEKSIRALACYEGFTFAASGNNVVVFDRAHQIAVWKAHSSKIKYLLEFGHFILSSDTEGHVCVWDTGILSTKEDGKPIAELHLGRGVTCLMHPQTYLDKVLFGFEDGRLQLWNIKSRKMVHEFKGWNSPVLTCVSSPALDVVGIGCGDGKIHVHNIRYDETIATFTHTTRGGVTALSFRTDGHAFLAAGGSSGAISIWDLEKKKLQTVINDAHDSEVASLHFLANEPVLMSNSKDNSLKMWIFDSLDGDARLLRYRSGHSAPPTCIRYYGEGRCILSGGQDRAFRLFSTIQDQQSRELSQGNVTKRAKRLKLKEEEIKLAPIVAFDAAEIRERDWCNVVTCHLDDCSAYTWRLQNFVIGEHVLKPCPEKPSPVKVCSISACGNFVTLGTASGHIERFNLQSGLHRGSYRDGTLADQSAHTGAVHGLASDATNACLFSAGYDKLIKVWNFKSLQLKASISPGSPIIKMTYHRGNGLAAVSSDDHVIRLYDMVAVRLVRVFSGHTDRITDFTFSEDGKWLLSSAMDATVRVWDVVAAKQLDAMRVNAAITALSLSPGMDMLATCHVNHKGIYLWGNRYMYSAGDIELGSGNAVKDVALPSSTGSRPEEGGDSNPEKVSRDNIELPGLEEKSELPSTAQITPELVTLSLLPKNQWQGLVHLDTVKARNKPIAAPKKPERAPFFLPTLPSLSGVPAFASPDQDSQKTKSVRLQSLSTGADTPSQFIQLVHDFARSGECLELLEHMKNLTSSSLDAEIRFLQIVDEDAPEEQIRDIGSLIDFLIKATSLNRDFDFVQAVMLLVLRIHGESILTYSQLRDKAETLREVQSSTWKRLDELLQKNRCIVSFLSNSAY
ncbi:WD repeat-containing protein 36 [Selaginella moellendorffii]|uniref:WD repeat-containing protein 36 n=1 Tax=Selaginella moellendorffii TaxID=88036 RepID=UPI000D1C84FC|nr:WD repeat-containing protein 36 [Selaginella moellendorffii]|eukprot:XP_024544156.1 WD repeat-containing protein 36 [Selaginella moellendorffii]